MNYSNLMDVQQEVKLVEKELVELIIQHLKANRIAVETARQQAKDFLSLLPIEDQRDLLGKLKGLGEKYEEAKEVYAEELGKINEAMRQQTLDQMRGFIQAGNIDSAIAAAKAMYPEKKTEGEHAQPVGLEHTAKPLPEVQPAPQAAAQPQLVVQQAETPAPQVQDSSAQPQVPAELPLDSSAPLEQTPIAPPAPVVEQSVEQPVPPPPVQQTSDTKGGQV